MITVYHFNGDKIAAVAVPLGAPFPLQALWVDVVGITREEEVYLSEQLRIDIPSHDELWQNRVLSRFYEEDGVHFMSASIITKVNSPHPETSTISFILTKDVLLTIRYITPTSFQNFAKRLLAAPQKFKTSARILEALLQEMIIRVVYNSEIVVKELDRLSHDIFNTEKLGNSHQTQSVSASMKEVLRTLGACADLNTQISESLHSIMRMLGYFQQIQQENGELAGHIQVLLTDVSSLSQQTGFLSDKITFLLDATLGMINVEQNLIIKVFSVFTVFFLPPTLFASIYGMNFHHMPFLDSNLGYPAALGIIALCAIAPYLYFRRKGLL